MDHVLFVMAVIVLVVTCLLAPGWTVGSLSDETTAGSWNPYKHYPFLLVATVTSLVLILAVGFLVYILNKSSILLEYLKLIVLNRYALLIGALLIGLVWLAMGVAPDLLRSLFVLHGAWQLFNVTWLASLVATMVMVTTRVFEENSRARFEIAIPFTDPEAPANAGAWDPFVRGVLLRLESITKDHTRWGLFRWLVLLLLGLPVPYACLQCSLQEGGGSDPRWFWWFCFGLAVGTAVLFLAGITALQVLFLKQDVLLPALFPFQQTLGGKLPRITVLDRLGSGPARLLQNLGPGYTAARSPNLAPGHAQVFLCAGIVLGAYLASYVLVLLFHGMPGGDVWFPSLFYLLLVVLLVGFVLEGMAFWLDYYPIPVSLIVVTGPMLLYAVNRTDHFFELNPQRGTDSAAARSHRPVLTLDDAARAWNFPFAATEKRTLVVVTAAGGGIQASAWTARVLVGLHELYGSPFTGSIGLISAVSGGSVGTMYYLDQWDDRTQPFQHSALAADNRGRPLKGSIRWNAQASGLEATAWGLAFPDLQRIFFPPLVSPTDDRGARIERIWQLRMRNRDALLTDWAARVRTGEMPIVVFNATVVETGQRFLASPVVARKPTDPRPNSTQARELLDLYPGADPRVATSVRLSATFPYVSPICRPLEARGPNENLDYHFADGGYVDNEGIVTVIEWLKQLLDAGHLDPKERGKLFDQILLVRIKPFPVQEEATPAVVGRGWVYALVGPLETIEHVRTASQTERNDLASGFFTEFAKNQCVPLQDASFVFRPRRDAGSIPLSWMLTERQKQNIDDAWTDLIGTPPRENPLAAVDRFFKRQ
jgi:hypothetical protein